MTQCYLTPKKAELKALAVEYKAIERRGSIGDGEKEEWQAIA